MGETRMTRDFFLWCMSVIYLFAFASLFVQIPGLYGDHGILPAKLVVHKEAESLSDLLTDQPTLLRLTPKLGLDVQTGLDFLCLGGVILSFVAMISRRQRNTLVFFILWAFYLSVFQVGQTFLWFQWDILLLEAGFLTLLVAPFNLFRRHYVGYQQHDNITMWLVKWLLFRLMFASGVVKLTSMCPTWWGLTALNYHYETQCIPTPAAWVFHQFPEWFQKLSVSSTFIIEIALPFLFFSPVRGQRLFAFYGQVLLQVLIILTGNYNFFNLLTLAMCLTLVDDNFLRKWLQKPPVADEDLPERLPVIGRFWRLIRWALNILVYGALVYWSVKLFTFRVKRKPSLHVSSKVAFSATEFNTFLVQVLPISIWLGVISLLWEILKSLVRSLGEKGMAQKMRQTAGVVFFGLIALAMFGVSLTPHVNVGRSTRYHLPDKLSALHAAVRPLKLASSYGLFRRMTGVGGRPEVVVEGSNSIDRGWKEYNFLYKPGAVSEKLPIVAPHQPRLDWQMWFAALGSYQHNPWFLNLCYRILQGEQNVLDLMGKNPFPNKPPKYLRAILYHYHFTSNDKNNTDRYSHHDWWVRKRVSEYLPIITKEDPSLVNYLQQAGIYEGATHNPGPDSGDKMNYMKKAFLLLRSVIGQPEGFYTVISLFIAGLVLTFLDPTVKLVEIPAELRR